MAALERGKVFVGLKEADIAEAARRLVPVRPCVSGPTALAAQAAARWVTGDLDVVYEDDALLVVSKPPGILSVPLERSRTFRPSTAR